jgi:DNA-binding transcriptional LysR family regulator
MKNQISVKALRGFHAIVETGSVTAAASILGMTQPAVSRLLAQLEGLIGFELFYRDHGRLVPTQDGMLMFEEVELSLNTLERVNSVVRDICEYRCGHLKLVAPPSFAEAVLPDIVAAFCTRFPRVRLTLESPTSEVAKSMIATRAVDGGFLRLPLSRADLTAESVVVSDTVCVMTASHPLARFDSLSPSALRGHPLILLGLGSAARASIEAAFLREGLRPVAQIEAHTVSAACAFASRGLGVALVNGLLAKGYVRNGAVTRRFDAPLPNEYAFVTSSLSTPTRLASAFLAETKDYFAQRSEVGAQCIPNLHS